LTDIDIFLCVYVPVETYQSQTPISYAYVTKQCWQTNYTLFVIKRDVNNLHELGTKSIIINLH